MKALVKKRNRYFIHWNIPKDVRHLFNGMAIYSRTLGTDNLGQAIIRRDQILSELENVVRKARINPERQRFLALVEDIRKTAARAAGEPEEDFDHRLETVWDGQDALLEQAIIEGDHVQADAIKVGLGWGDTTKIESKYTMTLKEAVKVYMEQEKEMTRTAISRLTNGMPQFLAYLQRADIHLEDIEKRDVAAWVVETSKAKSPKTIRAYTAGLSNVWEWAYRSREVDGVNPFRDLNVRLPSNTQKRSTFTVEQVAAMLDTATPAIYSLIKFGLVTGCRLSELTSLAPANFHKRDGVSYFHVVEGKTDNATRIVPLPVALWDELNKVVADGVWSRTESGTESPGEDYWSKLFSKHKDAVLGKDTGAVFHSFRKMTATAYKKADVFEGIAAELLGHSRQGLTMSYDLYATGHEPKKLMEAVEKMLAGEYMQSFLKLFPA